MKGASNAERAGTNCCESLPARRASFAQDADWPCMQAFWQRDRYVADVPGSTVGACPCASQLGKPFFKFGFLTEVLCQRHVPAAGISLHVCACAPKHSLSMLTIRQRKVDQALFTPSAFLALQCTLRFFMVPPPGGYGIQRGQIPLPEFKTGATTKER